MCTEYIIKVERPKEYEMDNRKIVRTFSAGVFFGEIICLKKKTATIRNARRIYYWEGAASLSQLAQTGTSRPDKCKFPESVDEIMVTEVIEILSVTQKAADSIDAVFIWKI